MRVVDSNRALRVLETSHPPAVYVPSADVRPGVLVLSDQPATHCEFKGAADYLDAIVEGRRRRAVAWTYPSPTPAYRALAGYVAFYPGRADGAWLDDERVAAQPGDFYGGWVTAEIQGPFKGGPGTWGW